ncbi:DUF6520 family protein [Flavobacterium fryxellicola]|uniref:DUF3551 domain-containing protein n=1 Tax=Flavobacterium fryxellicola TaxID=249352 RepID=A0A167VAE9_9FLAO|nr:DUF6520 family protein [Flavobacterium fryxellicola]OAB26222.1 hypothetical protein FBFR_13370 [Flavobacterium fryxellicola]
MKTEILKMIMPMAVIAVAVTGAFSSNAMNKNSKAFALKQGYTHTSPSSACNISNMCSDIGSDFCTVGAEEVRLWGKTSPNATTCNVPLYKNN